jgi:MFS transporter, PPP family, 3-phenylpropionic acid transporter
MFAATIVLAVNWTTIMPLIETVAVSGIRNASLDYGKVRLWGSLSFIVASFGACLVIGGYGAASVLPLLLLANGILVIGAHLLPRELSLPPSVVRRRISVADALQLARSPLFLLFLLAASTVQASHAVYYAFGTLHWREQGIPAGAIGALWAVGVVAEIGLFAIAGRVIAFFGAARLLMIASLAGVVRWTPMAFDPPLLATVILQSLHALSFGAAHLAAIHFLTHAVPEDRAATAQGIYAAVVAGLALGLTTIASGPLYSLFAGRAYAAMALLALISAVSARLLTRRWRGGLVVGPIEDQPHSSAGGGKTLPDA